MSFAFILSLILCFCFFFYQTGIYKFKSWYALHRKLVSISSPLWKLLDTFNTLRFLHLLKLSILNTFASQEFTILSALLQAEWIVNSWLAKLILNYFLSFQLWRNMLVQYGVVLFCVNVNCSLSNTKVLFWIYNWFFVTKSYNKCALIKSNKLSLNSPVMINLTQTVYTHF